MSIENLKLIVCDGRLGLLKAVDLVSSQVVAYLEEGWDDCLISISWRENDGLRVKQKIFLI